jgi:hypothetical protein
MLDFAKKGHEWLTWAAVAAGVATVIAAWTAPCGDAGVSYDLRASLYGLAPVLALAAGAWAGWRRKWWVAAVSVAALGVWAVGLMIAAISAALCNWTLF